MALHNDVRELLSQLPGRHPQLESVWWLKAPDTFRVTEKGVEVLRPDWLGPEPTITKLSEVPGRLANAFETAHTAELLDVYWLPGGDADLLLSDKGRAAMAEESTAVWLGMGRVRVDGKPVALELQEATVLQALVEMGGAATRPDLEKKSGVKDVAEVMRRLKDRFPDSISLPGKRGQGGYSTTIADASKT